MTLPQLYNLLWDVNEMAGQEAHKAAVQAAFARLPRFMG